MERGRGANHVTPSNDTSWSAHHPLWLKLKQIKPLPVIKHLRGSSPPSVASSPEKPARLGPTKRAQPSCCHHLCFSPEELRDFAPGFKKQNKTPTSHKDQCRYSPRPIFKAQRPRLEDDTDWKTKKSFLSLFKKLLWFCCYTKNCDLHCMVLDLYCSRFDGGEGWHWSPAASDSSLSSPGSTFK